MTWSTEAHLTDDQISMILDGVADETSQKHLAVCSDCQERVEEARHIEMALKQELFRYDCPPPHKLTDYFIGVVSVEERKIIEEHLGICVSCRKELETLTKFMEADEHRPNTISEKEKVFQPRADVFFAHLEAHQALRQVRGTKPSKEKRQMRAHVKGFDVLLDLQTVASGTAVEGMVIDSDDSQDWIGSLVEFRLEDLLHTTCVIDELGTFRCQLTEHGNYKIRISSPAGDVVVVLDLMVDT
jgi:hypothetical protein